MAIRWKTCHEPSDLLLSNAHSQQLNTIAHTAKRSTMHHHQTAPTTARQQGEPWCLCFSSDNRLLKVAPSLVQAVAPLPSVPDDSTPSLLRSTAALQTIAERVAALANAPARAWARADPAMWSLDGTVAMAKAALQLSEEAPSLAFARVDIPEELQAAITEQRARLAQAKKELRALSRSATGTASGARKAASGAAKAARMLEEAKQLRAELDETLNTTWAGFEAVVGVLQDAGAMVLFLSVCMHVCMPYSLMSVADDDDNDNNDYNDNDDDDNDVDNDVNNNDADDVAPGALAPTTLQCLPLGHVARQLNGDNELWMATVFSHAAVQVCVVISIVIVVVVYGRPATHTTESSFVM